jgi:mannose-1-phosphate guanylyltransferase/mannose-6-phosphate isomerase
MLFFTIQDQILTVYTPLDTTHRLENFVPTTLELIEEQLGSYLGEDDIVRFKNQYGR